MPPHEQGTGLTQWTETTRVTSDEIVYAYDDGLDLDEDRIRDAISSLESVGLIYATNQGWRPAK